MSKTITFTKAINIQQHLRYNDMATLPDGTPGFVGVTCVTDMVGVSDDGKILNPVQIRQTAGAPRATEYTPQEIATLVKGTNNGTGNFLVAELTKAYTEATGTTVV